MTDTEKLQRLFDRFTQIIEETIPAVAEGGDYIENRFEDHVGYLLEALTGDRRGRVSWCSVEIGADEVKDVFGELYDVGLIGAPLHRAAKQNLGRMQSMAHRLNGQGADVAPATCPPRAANTNHVWMASL